MSDKTTNSDTIIKNLSINDGTLKILEIAAGNIPLNKFILNSIMQHTSYHIQALTAKKVTKPMIAEFFVQERKNLDIIQKLEQKDIKIKIEKINQANFKKHIDGSSTSIQLTISAEHFSIVEKEHINSEIDGGLDVFIEHSINTRAHDLYYMFKRSNVLDKLTVRALKHSSIIKGLTIISDKI